MRARAAAGLGALLLLVNCGKGPTTAGSTHGGQSPSTADGGSFALTDRIVDDVVREVTGARQIEPKRAIAIERLSHDRFVEQLLGGRGAKEESAELTPRAALLIGFDFLPEPGKRGGITGVDEVLEEQVVGFYDRSLDKVFLPDVQMRSEDELLEQKAVLAHEVHHALQAQHFGKFPKATSSDESIAQLALIEGDAQVAMGAWLGAEAGAPVGRTLRRIVEVTERVPLASVTRGEGSAKLDKALELTRQELEFPYKAGMLLVSDVYRTGGFPLVDSMYEHFPRSTEQVLHPEKYLVGELPRPIAEPAPPKGYTLSTTDTLGELATRILLERCLAPKVAERAAAGWAGDRFGVFVGPDRHLAVAWISAWDTEGDAAEALAALGKSADCWHDNALGRAESDYTIGAAFHVEKKGKLVAFLRGFAKDAEAGLVKQLFSLVGVAPPRVSLTSLTIPPRIVLPEPAPGRIAGDVYRNDWLGIVGRVPEGMRGHAGGDVDFTVERTDVLVRGGVSISTRIVSDEQNEKTFREVEDHFVTASAKLSRHVQALGGGPVETALGAGIERTWRIVGTTVEVRFVLVPICAGTGSVVFVQTYGDPYARSVLDGWMDSFRWMHGRNIRACDFLDPK
jgi:hypothetical protein